MDNNELLEENDEIINDVSKIAFELGINENNFNQRTAFIAALMNIVKYGYMAYQIIQFIRDLAGSSKSKAGEDEYVILKEAEFKEADFKETIIDALKSLPSYVKDILKNSSTQELIVKKFNLDPSTVKLIIDAIITVMDAISTKPEEVEKEKSTVEETSETSEQKETPESSESKIVPASKYTQVSSTASEDDIVLKEASEEDIQKFEDKIIALAKEYNIKEVQDIEIELSKEGEILSIRRKEAVGFREKDLGLSPTMTGLISLVAGKVTNPQGSWMDRGKEFMAGYLGGPLGAAGYHIGKQLGHEYWGFVAGWVLQSVLNATVMNKDPNAKEEDKQKANENVDISKRMCYNTYVQMKMSNPNNKAVSIISERMRKDNITEETAYWREMYDNSDRILKAIQEAA